MRSCRHPAQRSWAAVIALASALTAHSNAQEPSPKPADAAPAQPTQPRPGPEDLTGRSFAGLTIAAGAQPGDISISASRGWAWTEENPPPILAGTAAETSRLYLVGDVRIDLGMYHFIAARAVGWVEQAGISEDDPTIPVYQVAVYFDRVDDPAAQAGVSQHGDRLMVTGMLAGKLKMKADVLLHGRPADDLVREAEQRMARLQREVRGRGGPAVGAGEPAPVPQPSGEPPTGPIRPGVSRPFEPESPLARGESGVPAQSQLPPTERLPPIFADRGTITFGFGPRPEVVLMTGADEDALVATGGVTMAYNDPRRNENLLVTAERCVAFFEKGAAANPGAPTAPGKVHGVYLEGDVVASNGKYTLRSPRIYYDVVHNAAVAVDAVFSTFDDKSQTPMYIRARAMRQEASNRFSASGAELSNSSFADPLFAIGASAITITRNEASSAGGRSTVNIAADDVTARFSFIPFFYYPHFSGDMEDFPLERVVFGSSSSGGFTARTSWNLFTLLGMDPPPGVKARLLVDGYTRRGAALGGDVSWNSETAAGHLYTYGIIEDNGSDHLPSGAHVDHDGDTRGFFFADHRWTIDENWTAFLEGSYVGDPTFLPAFFRNAAETAREFTNAAYIRRLEDDTALTFLAKGEFMDFTPNEYLQQSLGYNTDKLPELAYYRLADDVLGGIAPGLLSYSSEYRVGLMRLNFTEPTARQMGFDTPERSLAAFGILPDQSIGQRLRARGLTEHDVARFDTRQELAATADWGPVKLTPFVTGRLTAYDHDFVNYSPDADENVRLWGAAGARASTSFEHVDNSVDSAALDLHRIRHIVEPSVTVWSGGANVSQNDLPVYDDSVESIASGTAVRFGVNNTWQTQRGGEGRWRSVDWLKINVDGTFSTSDADKESPIGRFFDYRPEYSLLGNFATASAVWQATDALAITALENYDLDIHQPAYTVLGAKVDHTPDFSTYAELRYINARDITIVGAGADLQLTRKYWIGGYVAYDTTEGKLQWVSATFHRRFAEVTFGLRIGYDNISEDFNFGVEIQPLGAQNKGDILTRLQRDSY